MSTILEAQTLHKSYGSLEAVRGIDLKLDKGEIFGLLGPNGAGKSTTMTMLAGIQEPTRGTITLFGQAMGLKNKALKMRIGYVPQDLILYDRLSAMANLEFYASLYKLKGRERKQAVAHGLEAVGLTDRAKDKVEGFSGGMKRRLNIAAALLHKPEFMIFDEPTVGVDPQSRNSIFEIIEGLKAKGVTIVYCTHYMEEAQRLCDRLGIVDHGEIVAQGSPRELIERFAFGVVDLAIAPGQRTEDELMAALEAALQGVLEVKRGKADEEVPGLAIRLTTNNMQQALTSLFQFLGREDITMTQINVEPPNLESAFLQLTGHSLRQ